MITQTSSSIYDYWAKIIASKSKTIAITTFAITNDTSGPTESRELYTLSLPNDIQFTNCTTREPLFHDPYE